MATNMYILFEDPNIGTGDGIEILSWSHGFVQPTSPTRGGGTVEQASHQNLSFTKYLDANSTEIMKMCWSGKQFKKATVTCYRADGATDNKPVKYLSITMQNVLISNYSVSGGPGDVPVENISLDYGVVNYEYTQQRGANVAATHDLNAKTVT